MRSEHDVNRAIDDYADMVRRICFCHLKSAADTEDIFQDVFLKLMLRDEPFDSPDHEKAWLIRVSVNACKDHLRMLFRHATVSIDEAPELPATASEDHAEVLEAVLALPEKYRDVIYLHYYEGYPAARIAQILGVREGTVHSILSRGRDKLRERLGGELDD